ncbi:MAG: DUF4349 domain-containing protein [Planctomycetes bacterium]|nr:DUF4349 domain-containing protein [Planctomycetota bacterium]
MRLIIIIPLFSMLVSCSYEGYGYRKSEYDSAPQSGLVLQKVVKDKVYLENNAIIIDPSEISEINAESRSGAGKVHSEQTLFKIPALNDRLLIYQAILKIEVPNAEEAVNKVIQLTTQYKGWLKGQLNSTIIIRVPAADFTKFLEEVSKMGVVKSKSIQTEDITEQYTDLTIRLENALVVQKRLHELLARAEIKDALQIELELKKITEEIELLKGKIKMYDQLVAFSTVTIHFGSKGAVETEQFSIKPQFSWLKKLGVRYLLSYE